MYQGHERSTHCTVMFQTPATSAYPSLLLARNRCARWPLPSTYGVEAYARTFGARPDWAVVLADLGVCAGVGVVSLAVATWAYRRAAVR